MHSRIRAMARHGCGSIASSIPWRHAMPSFAPWKPPPSTRRCPSSKLESCRHDRKHPPRRHGDAEGTCSCASVSPWWTLIERVKLIECPRDAWQGLPGIIPTAVKVAYLRALIAAGFKHLDAVSFVSPKAVPQMADSEEVLRELDPPDDVEIIGIVANERGMERAINSETVTVVGFPYSVSETFLKNNVHQTLEEAIDTLEKIKQDADSVGMGVVAYISMAFGNPYGDAWNADEVVEAVRLLSDMGIETISLADTVGLADVDLIEEVVSAVIPQFSG